MQGVRIWQIGNEKINLTQDAAERVAQNIEEKLVEQKNDDAIDIITVVPISVTITNTDVNQTNSDKQKLEIELK